MVVNLTIIITPDSIHVGMEQHHYEGVEQVEQQPGIHHLHVGGLGQAVTDVDEHRRQHQHTGQIYSNDCLKGFQSFV